MNTRERLKIMVDVKRAQEDVKRLQREMEVALLRLRDAKRKHFAHEIASGSGLETSNEDVQLVANALEMWDGNWQDIRNSEEDLVSLWEYAIRDGNKAEAWEFTKNLCNLIAYGTIDV